MSNGPFFTSSAILSSSDAEYKARAIQLYGRPRFEGHSCHQEDYQQWELPVHERHKPAETIKPNLPFTGSSAYAEMYPAHPLEPLFRRDVPVYKRSNAKFEATSSYAQDFDAKTLPPGGLGGQSYQPYRQSSKPISTGKFEGVSTNHTDFVAHPLDAKSLSAKPQLKTIRHLPFDGTTTNSEDYKHWTGIDPVFGVRRPDSTIKSLLPFDGTTTSQDTFKTWSLPTSRKSLGIAIVGDRLHILIAAQLPTPVSRSQAFTTVHNGQTEMSIMIYEGSNPVASKNRLLGQFKLARVPAAPIGVPKIKVRYSLDAQNSLTVVAQDLGCGVQHVWQQSREQPMIAPLSCNVGEIAMLPSQEALALC